MKRTTWIHGLISLLGAACAHPSPPTSPAGRACSSYSEARLSAAHAQGLARATNALEYENAWRASQPAASTGTVDSAGVQAIIRAHRAEIQQCYETALRSSSERGGRVVVRFVIAQDGHVPNVDIGASEISAPELSCCVVERVARWTFPKPENGSFVVVEYPFAVRLAAAD